MGYITSKIRTDDHQVYLHPSRGPWDDPPSSNCFVFYAKTLDHLAGSFRNFPLQKSSHAMPRKNFAWFRPNSVAPSPSQPPLSTVGLCEGVLPCLDHGLPWRHRDDSTVEGQGVTHLPPWRKSLIISTMATWISRTFPSLGGIWVTWILRKKMG